MTRDDVVKAANDAYGEAMLRGLAHDKAIEAVCNAVLDKVRCLMELAANESEFWTPLDGAITEVESLMAPVK